VRLRLIAKDEQPPLDDADAAVRHLVPIKTADDILPELLEPEPPRLIRLDSQLRVPDKITIHVENLHCYIIRFAISLNIGKNSDFLYQSRGETP
jgi:hypothetical protein